MTQHFDIATPRNNAHSPAPSLAYTPRGPCQQSDKSRSPPGEAPVEAGATATHLAHGRGGMEVETGVTTISAISSALLGIAQGICQSKFSMERCQDEIFHHVYRLCAIDCRHHG